MSAVTDALATITAPGFAQVASVTGLNLFNDPTGLTPANTSSINCFTYTDRGIIIGDAMYFIGTGHGSGTGTTGHFLKYDFATNTVTRITPPSWLVGIVGDANHAYNLTTGRLSTSTIYRVQKHASRTIRAYDIASPPAADWTSLTSIPEAQFDNIAATVAMQYMPNVGGASGSLVCTALSSQMAFRYDIAGNSWHTMNHGSVVTDLGSTSNFMKYNSTRDHAIFGNGTANLYRINSTGGTFTRLGTPPFALGMPGDTGTCVTEDPATGEFIVINADRELWRFDADTDDWNLVLSGSTDIPINTTSTGNACAGHYCIGAEHLTLECSMYFVGKGGNDNGIWVYKSGESSGGSSQTKRVMVRI